MTKPKTYKAGFSILVLLLMLLPFSLLAQLFRNEWIDYSKTYYKFSIRETRVYRIPFSLLDSAGLGNTPGSAFQLFSQGEEVPLFVSSGTAPLGPNDFIEFIGKRNDGRLDKEMFDKPNSQAIDYVSLISDSTFFYLTISPNTSNRRFVQSDNNVASTSLVADSFFQYTQEYFFGTGWYNLGGGRLLATIGAPAAENIARSSNYVEGEGFTTQPIYVGNEQGIAIAGLQFFPNSGASNFLLNYKASSNYEWGTRNIELLINDSLSSKLLIPGATLQTRTNEAIPVSRIINDRLNIRFRIDNPYWQENAYMNQLSITYPRKFHFGLSRFFSFELPATGTGNHLRIAGFRNESRQSILYDLTYLRRYLGVLKQDSVLFALPPSTQKRELVLATNNNTLVTPVAKLQSVNFRDFGLPGNTGSFNLIADTRYFTDTAGNVLQDYADYRSSAAGGGYRSAIIDMDEIADQFAHGIRKHPLALRNFFRYLQAKTNRTNDHFLLVGRFMLHWTYRLHQPGEMARFNSVPTWGIPPSDVLLSAKDNNTFYPTVNFGRIPAMNALELRNYLSKVKSYEYNLNVETRPEERIWQKRAAFLSGAGDAFRSQVLAVTNKTLVAEHSQNKWGTRNLESNRTPDTDYPKKYQTIDKWMNEGLGLISFFGETASSSIDYGLERPDQYLPKNGKFPFFIGTGCYLGGYTQYTVPPGYFGERINRYDIDFGEFQLFEPNNGSISLITATDIGAVNYLRIYQLNFLKEIKGELYGKTIGEQFRVSHQKLWESFPRKDDLLFQHIMQTFNLFSDPALKMFDKTKPDVALGSGITQQLFRSPSSGNDSILVKVPIYNIGTDLRDNRNVKIKASLMMPWGERKNLPDRNVFSLIDEDSIMVAVSYAQAYHPDTVWLEVTADPDNTIDELTKANNTKAIALIAPPPGLKPIKPAPYSTIATAPQVLEASTFNGLAYNTKYRLQIDTTTQFNSGLLVQKEIEASGGKISFAVSDISFLPNQVYYWRTSGVQNGEPVNWQTASFHYQPNNAKTFSQSHWWQWLDSSKNYQARVNSTSRQLQFPDSVHTLFAGHGIFGTSGWQESHFSMERDGKSIAFSACVGSSIIFNLFDPITLAPIPNTNSGFMGSGPVCQETRRNNFEYRYFPAANRQKISEFMDWIPDGTFVMARMVLDPPFDSSYAQFWAKDTLIYGNNSLYKKLKQAGFHDLDSMNLPRTFAFVYKKNDKAHYTPQTHLSEGRFDRILKNFFIGVPYNGLRVTSPVLGPATSWQDAGWQIEMPDGSAVKDVRLLVVGISNNGSKVVLKQSDLPAATISLSDIDAREYPALYFEYQAKGDIKLAAPQLRSWYANFATANDVAPNTNLYFRWSGDTLYQDLQKPFIEIAIENTGMVPSQAIPYLIVGGEHKKVQDTLQTGSIKSLQPGDTAIIRYASNEFTSGDSGYFQLMINEKQQVLEALNFNGFGYRKYTVVPNKFSLLEFDAVPRGNDVDVTWEVAFEGPVEKYEVEYGRSPQQFETIYSTNKKTTNGNADYEYLHTQRPVGYHYYRLKIINVRGDVSYSVIKRVWIGEVQPVTIYPNPFRNFATIVPFNNDVEWKAVLIDASGRKVLELKATGAQRLDGRNLSAGNYFLRWMMNDEIITIPLQKL